MMIILIVSKRNQKQQFVNPELWLALKCVQDYICKKAHYDVTLAVYFTEQESSQEKECAVIKCE